MTRGHYGTERPRPPGRAELGDRPARPIIRVIVLDEHNNITKRRALWVLPGQRPDYYVESASDHFWLFDDPNGEHVIQEKDVAPESPPGFYNRRFRKVYPVTPPLVTSAGAHPVVGISLYHSVEDRERAIEQINTDFTVLVNELLGKAGADPRAFVADHAAMARDPVGYAKRTQAATAALEKSPLYPLWRDVVSPVWREWNNFRDEQSYWERFKTDWETYEQWQDRFKTLRETVIKQTDLVAPAPTPLAETLPGQILEAGKKVAKGAAGGASDVWTMVKIGIYGALGIGAVIALSSVVSNLRKGQDPAEKYMALARSGAAAAGRR